MKHDHETSPQLLLSVLAIIGLGSLIMFTAIHLPDPIQQRVDRVAQAQTQIASAVQAIHEAESLDGDALRQASLQAFEVVRTSARDIPSEYFLKVSQALQDAELLEETVEVVDLSLMHPVPFEEKLELLHLKADSLRSLQQWENTRMAFNAIRTLLRENESFFTTERALAAAYYRIYFNWIDLETRLKECDYASTLFDTMTTSTWYTQLPYQNRAQSQNFIDRIDQSIAFACSKVDVSGS